MMRQPREQARAAALESEDLMLVERLIDNGMRRFDSDEVKLSLGDLIRLVQLRRELRQEQPKEVEVRWIDSRSPVDETSSGQ